MKIFNRNPHRYLIILLLSVVLLLIAVFLSVSIGVSGSSFTIVKDLLTAYDNASAFHNVIVEVRIPRIIAAILTGAAFALSGAIMQRITANPFADTGLLGINAGAGFFVAVGLVLFQSISFFAVIVLAFCGAAFGTLLVYSIGFRSKSGITPLRLLLAGAAITALLTSLSQGIAIYYGLAKDLTYWSVGSLSGISWQQLQIVAPVLITGFIAALVLAPYLSALAFGEETAINLGVHVHLVRTLAILIVLILAGTSVSIVGGISFLGLMIPHIAVFLVGPNDKKFLPVTAILGSTLLVLADIAGRTINAPYDTPVGALVAVIGVPFFLVMTYYRIGGKLWTRQQKQR